MQLQPLPEVPSASSVSVARRVLAQVIGIVQQDGLTEPAEGRERIRPYLLSYSAAFANQRNRAIGWLVDSDDMKQIVWIRALDALDRLDLSLPVNRQLAYLHTVVSSAVADACRANDRLGRRGRSRRSAFLLAVEVATQNSGRSLTNAELDSIAQEIIGDGSSHVDFYRCRFGVDPVLSGNLVNSELSSGIAQDAVGDPEEYAMRTELHEAIASHPDREVSDFLRWALTGQMPQRCRNKNVVPRPKQIVERLGPRLSQLLAIDYEGAA